MPKGDRFPGAWLATVFVRLQRAARRLVLCPLGRLLFVSELGAGIMFGKHPVDSSLGLVHSAAPGLNLFAESLYIGDSPFAEALPGQDANFDLRLIEPTAVYWRVVDREAVPDLTAYLGAQQIRQ